MGYPAEIGSDISTCRNMIVDYRHRPPNRELPLPNVLNKISGEAPMSSHSKSLYIAVHDPVGEFGVIKVAQNAPIQPPAAPGAF